MNKAISGQKTIGGGKAALYALTFFLPAAILLLAYARLGISPFGPNTVLICDLSGQYIDFYSAYYDMITQGRSLLYSWQAGLGLNFLGIISYYLASPFSLLILLSTKENLPQMMMWIILLKVGFSGLFFAVYARRLFRLPSPTLIALALLYALSAYSVVYSFNLMWLDGVLILPLLLFGVEKIIAGETPARFPCSPLFFVCLFYIFIANYYIAYMAGLFALLYFTASFFSRFSFREVRIFLRKFKVFFFSAILAAGCAAFLLLPTFYALKNGPGGPDLSLALSPQINFQPADLFAKLALGGYDTLKDGGLPNVYCGLLPLLLAPLYFFNREIPKKERAIAAVLTAFLLFSFNFSILNFAWHAFDRPNFFFYRYSFVFCFLMIALACRSFMFLSHLSGSQIVKAGAAWILLFMFIQKLDYPFLSDRQLTVNFLFFALYTLILLLLRELTAKRLQAVLLTGLTLAVIVESAVSSSILTGRLDQEFRYVPAASYAQKLNPVRDILSLINKQDGSFYRLEKTAFRSYNDPLNLNYNGLTHFSSLANYETNLCLRQLGFMATSVYKATAYAVSGSTVLADSLLGIKYVVSAGDMGAGYTKVIEKGDLAAYRNDFALPLCYLVNEAVLAFDPAKDDNPFTLQEKLISLAEGRSEPTRIFRPVATVREKLTNVSRTSRTVNGSPAEIYERSNAQSQGIIEFTFTNPAAQQLYACFRTITASGVKVFVNGQEIKEELPVYNKRIINLGFYLPGEKISVKLTFSGGGFALTEKYFYGLSESRLAQALSPLQEQKAENLQVTDTSVRGVFTVGENRLLFTSIPYDPGWEARVDGQKAEILKIGDAFIGLLLPPGKHEVFLSFCPEGLVSGITISGISLLLLSLGAIFSLIRTKIKYKR